MAALAARIFHPLRSLAVMPRLLHAGAIRAAAAAGNGALRGLMAGDQWSLRVVLIRDSLHGSCSSHGHPL
eukprot:m.63605 g.63605  ORF g.63605 m.63605 type:complete len:70 (+) comp7466_c0_seq4:27-236(+)